MLDTEEATVGVLKIPRIFEREREKKKVREIGVMDSKELEATEVIEIGNLLAIYFLHRKQK